MGSWVDHLHQRLAQPRDNLRQVRQTEVGQVIDDARIGEDADADTIRVSTDRNWHENRYDQ
jgi:hypothetical protein